MTKVLGSYPPNFDIFLTFCNLLSKVLSRLVAHEANRISIFLIPDIKYSFICGKLKFSN